MRSYNSEVKLPSLKLLPASVDSHESISARNYALQKKQRGEALIRQLNMVKDISIDQSSDGSMIAKRLELEEAKAPLPTLELFLGSKGSRASIKQSLIGAEAVEKFYSRYKMSDRAKQIQVFTRKSDPLTEIVCLLDTYNLAPRRLDIFKLKGSEAILDLNKLGLGRSSAGNFIASLVGLFHHFERINLASNGIGAEIADHLIPALSNLQVVNLSHNRIGRNGCMRLAQMLNSSCSITEINLCDNALTDQNGAIIFNSLNSGRTLKILNLSHNMLAHKSALALAQLLRNESPPRSQFLRQLYLAWNQFTDKATKMIFEALQHNQDVKVLDFSWNRIDEYNVPALSKTLISNKSLVHLDISFCEIGPKEAIIIAEALKNNHTIYGMHCEGNNGYINHLSFLIPSKAARATKTVSRIQKGQNLPKREQQKQSSSQPPQYPLPLVHGITREISGVNACSVRNEYRSDQKMDVCWICECWQELVLRFPVPPDTKEMFIHFSIDEYEGKRLNQTQLPSSKNAYFQTVCMVPMSTPIKFFLSHLSLSAKRSFFPYPGIPSECTVITYKLGTTSFTQQIPYLHITSVPFISQLFDEDYDPCVRTKPRSNDVTLFSTPQVLQYVKTKEKRIRQQKVEIKYREMPSESVFLQDTANQDENADYIRKCVQADISKNKVHRLVKSPQDLAAVKEALIRHYKNLKDCFYSLARNFLNATNGIYSMGELDFDKFIHDLKFVSKRVTHAKLKLKMYACLNQDQSSTGEAGKLFCRPQFMEFMIRMAIEKWCMILPAKKVKDDEDNESPQKQPREALSLVEGIEKTLKHIGPYARATRAANWRKDRFLKPEVEIVIKAYNSFLNSLHEKYSGANKKKVGKDKMLQGLIIIDQVKEIFLKSGLKKTKESMKDVEMGFIDSKQLEIHDGILQFGLNLDEFTECLGRVSATTWCNPPELHKKDFWLKEKVRMATPLFVKFEALLAKLYSCEAELHSKPMDRLSQQGIFRQEFDILVERISARAADNSGSPNDPIRITQMESTEDDISLAEVIAELQNNFGSKIVEIEEQVELESFT